MAVYIDAARQYYGGKAKWCHLWADEGQVEELHTFAKRIGLKRAWFQDHAGHPHYDIKSPAIRLRALDAGAEPLSYRSWLRKRQAPKETDLGECVVAWLREWQWEVWQEIAFDGSGTRADVVGLRDDLLCVVEVKKSLTFDVIAQARRWGMHYRYVAVPFARRDDGRLLAYAVCAAYGIGVLQVNKQRDYKGEPAYTVEVEVKPKLLRIGTEARDHKVKALRGMPPNYAPAGSTSGKGFSAWSSYKGTMERVRLFLLAHPGSTVAEILQNVEHHYASAAGAKSAIPKWLQSVESKWCETRREGEPMRLRFYVRPGFEKTPVGDFSR